MTPIEGRCHCGCGHQTSLDRNGEPRQFLHGHNGRGQGDGWIEQGHRFISLNGKRIAEHRAVMEEHLGRTLGPEEVVHHVDHDPFNNEIDNLVILDRSEHMRLHVTGPKRMWTADEKARAVELYESGMSIDEVARALGRPYASTYKNLAKAGVLRRPEQTRRLRRERLDQARGDGV